MDNLYVVEYICVSSDYDVAFTSNQPTHVIASSQELAVELALAQTPKYYHLNRCYLHTENVRIIREEK